MYHLADHSVVIANLCCKGQANGTQRLLHTPHILDYLLANLLSTYIALSTDHDVTQVSWSGVPNPTAADAVALVIPTSYAPDVNLHNTVPLKYRWALQTNPNYLTTGSGSTT